MMAEDIFGMLLKRPTASRVLDFIAKREPSTVYANMLVSELGLCRETVSEVLESLEANELVKSNSFKIGGKKYYSSTPEGLAATAAFKKAKLVFDEEMRKAKR